MLFIDTSVRRPIFTIERSPDWINWYIFDRPSPSAVAASFIEIKRGDIILDLHALLNAPDSSDLFVSVNSCQNLPLLI